jgi:hypothetical protein
MKWEFCGSSHGSETTWYYEHRARSGKFYTKTVYEYHGVSITRYPSEEYYERELMGLNTGARARTWERI